MPTCNAFFCWKEAAPGGRYCPEHLAKESIPDLGEWISGPSRPKDSGVEKRRSQIKQWCSEAKVEINQFLDGNTEIDKWLSHFFNGNNANAAKKVMAQMPGVLDQWSNELWNVVERPIYDQMRTPNSVSSDDGTLSVAPSFFKKNDQKWVLVHEASHGVHLLDKSLLTPVVDLRYEDDGEAFHELEPAERLKNADHYRACIQQFRTSTFDKSGKYVVRASSSSNASTLRVVGSDKSYSFYVQKASLDFLQLISLQMVDLLGFTPQIYHVRNKKLPDDQRKGHLTKEMYAHALNNPEAEELDAKEFQKLVQLYRSSRVWIGAVNTGYFSDVYDVGGQCLVDVDVAWQKEAKNFTYKVTSDFTHNMQVDEAALRRGVKKVLESSSSTNLAGT